MGIMHKTKNGKNIYGGNVLYSKDLRGLCLE